MIRAVVPARILRRWDAIAAAQLCNAAASLADEVDRLRISEADAWAMLDCEREFNRELLSEHCEVRLGITKDGAMVLLPGEQPRTPVLNAPHIER